MPIKSSKQFGLMAAAAHGKMMGKGPSKAVAEEMMDETPAADRSKFAKQQAAKRKKKAKGPHPMVEALRKMQKK